MYATFDRNSPQNLSAEIHSLSWKGDARQGWLAAGNSRKTVGVTFTELLNDLEEDCGGGAQNGGDEETEPAVPLVGTAASPEISLERQGMRRNFNFREHSAEVTIVQWNKHLDKIATCDASGTVIVWRNHNGRSVMELVNNRGIPISDFKWSNDGTKVLIAYTDGYILVGTAYGRRIWARNLNLGSFVTSPASHSQNSKLLSSTWSPDDSRIVIGSSIGELIELNATHGGMLVSTTEVLPGIGIIGLEWVEIPKPHPLTGGGGSPSTAEKALVERPQRQRDGLAGGQPALEAASDPDGTRNSGNVRLSLYLRNGKVVLMNSCGDQQATIIRTGLMDGRMAWAGKGSILAVAGFRKSQGVSTVRFFQPTGQLMFTLSLGTKEPVTAITWAHGDQKIFIATKTLLHSLTIRREIPSLQSLCQKAIGQFLPSRGQSYNLVLPLKLKMSVVEVFDSVIQGHIPQPNKLLDYISCPPPHSHRTYCTVIPNPSATATTSNHHGNHHQRRHPSSYTLYVEHLGTLIPILVGHKRSTKLRQSFTISLPTHPQVSNSSLLPQQSVQDTLDRTELSESTDSTLTVQSHVRGLSLFSQEGHNSLNTESGVQLACREDEAVATTMAEAHLYPILPGDVVRSASNGNSASATPSNYPHQLVEVTSNVMASKFKIQSLTERLPADMGTVLIKTSFLHIQPRKVIVCLPHLEDHDSGIDSDACSLSGESIGESERPLGNFDSSFVQPDELIESLTSMEDLQLPKSIDLDSQGLRLIEAQQSSPSFRAHSNSCGPSFGMGRAQVSAGGVSGSIQGSLSPSSSSTSSTEPHVQIHSKTPTWNEQHMIYQLDFGGRVTTKSAKNFQLELDGEQVLQFGKIDNGCFILDFQAPFSPVQAFATALANLV